MSRKLPALPFLLLLLLLSVAAALASEPLAGGGHDGERRAREAGGEGGRLASLPSRAVSEDAVLSLPRSPLSAPASTPSSPAG